MHYLVDGTVQDQTGNPVAGAGVQLQTSTRLLSTRTDSQGRFVFQNLRASSGSISVRAPGFAVTRREWNSGGKAESSIVVVLPLARLAQQVTVTAARTTMLVGKTAGSVVVLSQAQLASTAALTLDGALRQVPGFSLFRRTGSRTANPTTQGVSLRGEGASGASRALVLEDGFPLNDPFGGWVYWDRVPREAVERIEVAQGGASDLYGSDALGGVINIITRRARQDEFSLDTSYGNENTPDASFWGSIVSGKWGVDLGAEAFNTDGYILTAPDERGNIDTRAGSNHTDGTLTLRRQVSRSTRVFLRGSVLGEARKNGTPIQTNRTHLRELAAGLDSQNTSLGKISLRAYGEAQLLDQNFSAVSASRNSEALTDLQRVPAQEAGFSAQWTKGWGSWQTFVAGADGQNVRGASNELKYTAGRVNSATGAGGRQNIGGLFGEDIIRAGSRWIFTVNGRLDSWRNYNALSVTRPLASSGPLQVTDFPPRSASAFSPRLSALRQLTPSVSLYAAAYRAFRAPTLNELYRPFRVGNVLTLANSTLGAERLTGAEGGAAWTPHGDKLRVHASFFWSEVRQPIANVTLQSTPSLITDERENLGSTRSEGVDVEAESELRPGLIVSGGYQYVDATVLSFPANRALEGLFVPQIPRNAFTFQVRYARPIIALAVQGRYTGVQYDDDLNYYPLAPAFAMDVFASHRFGSRIEVYGAVENATDQRYEVARVPYTQLGPPLLARIGLRFNWGAR
ncbi:MAG: TonB-dependent receptor [Terriglobia bacterium]